MLIRQEGKRTSNASRRAGEVPSWQKRSATKEKSRVKRKVFVKPTLQFVNTKLDHNSRKKSSGPAFDRFCLCSMRCIRLEAGLKAQCRQKWTVNFFPIAQRQFHSAPIVSKSNPYSKRPEKLPEPAEVAPKGPPSDRDHGLYKFFRNKKSITPAAISQNSGIFLYQLQLTLRSSMDSRGASTKVFQRSACTLVQVSSGTECHCD